MSAFAARTIVCTGCRLSMGHGKMTARTAIRVSTQDSFPFSMQYHRRPFVHRVLRFAPPGSETSSVPEAINPLSPTAGGSTTPFQYTLRWSTRDGANTTTTRRSFAAAAVTRRNRNSKGDGRKNGAPNNNDDPLSNEGLIGRLVRESGSSSADDVMVRLVIDEGPNQPSTVEIMTLSEAIQVSLDRGMDLVATSIEKSDPPVVRATDLAKSRFRRQQALKNKQQEAVNNKKEKKSFRFRAGIDNHDLERKLSQMITYLEKGHECEYSVLTKARVMRTNTDAGLELLDRIQGHISEFATLKKEPEKNETGSFYRVMLRPRKS